MECCISPALCLPHHRHDGVYGPLYHRGYDLCGPFCQHRRPLRHQHRMPCHQPHRRPGDHDRCRRERGGIPENGGRTGAGGEGGFHPARPGRRRHRRSDPDLRNPLAEPHPPCPGRQRASAPLLPGLSGPFAPLSSRQCDTDRLRKSVCDRRKTGAGIRPVRAGGPRQHPSGLRLHRPWRHGDPGRRPWDRTWISDPGRRRNGLFLPEPGCSVLCKAPLERGSADRKLPERFLRDGRPAGRRPHDLFVQPHHDGAAGRGRGCGSHDHDLLAVSTEHPVHRLFHGRGTGDRIPLRERQPKAAAENPFHLHPLSRGSFSADLCTFHLRRLPGRTYVHPGRLPGL